MLRKAGIVTVVLGVAFAGFGVGFLHAQNSSGQAAQPAPSHAPAAPAQKPDVPAYHLLPPQGALPDTLAAAQFSDPETQNIYALAAKVKPVLYQQPCYCRCDKEDGHKSLLDCFTDYHGAHCALCKKEAVLAYTETQQGKSAAEIRKDIMDGKWKTVDLSPYDTLPSAK
ncbi:MAG: CYCXC family (seleno)protein [Candidatus Acidiferrales bacterium]